jgi:hypothetical protein
LKQTATATLPQAKTPSPAERRRTRRVAISQPISARPHQSLSYHFEEVRATINVSIGGLYFRTWRPSYRKGMGLIISCLPSAEEGGLALEYLARVVRVEPHADYRFGVAVQLLSPLGAVRTDRPRRSRAS